MTKKYIEGIETVRAGFANGISTQFAEYRLMGGKEDRLPKAAIDKIVENASKAYGDFLTALGCDWQNDPNSNDTPRRVAKAYIEKWKGRYEVMPPITAFPSDGYDGTVIQSNIPLTSMCSHHHESVLGFVTIAYIASGDGQVVGLSKLNRIVEHFARRGQIQEQLTVAIHNAVDKICEGNLGVGVSIDATHACVSCRGVKHQGASMQTTKLSGCFLTEPSAKAEFMMHVSDAVKKR